MCGGPCKVMGRLKEFLPKPKMHFSGSSPPEVFVGRIGYPKINTGILSPQEHGDTEEMSLPELWYEKNMSIQEILANRSRLVYSRFKSQVKDTRKEKKFLGIMQEISMASKSVSTEIFLKSPIKQRFEIDRHHSILANPAPLQAVRLEENPYVEKKVDYLVSDVHVKAAESMKELYLSGKIATSNIIKILSVGLLGLKKNRKLVPTRWSITATDDTLSKFLLDKIRFYPQIQDIRLFHGYYVGNHYEILMLPDVFAFEVIEAYMCGSSWNPFSERVNFSVDYEDFNGRKKYASNVTGAYYTARLGVAEYLEKIRRQASVLIFREERPEYNAPLGVGILRELCRDALSKKPEICESLSEAFVKMQSRMKLPVKEFKDKSWLLANYGKQTRLSKWF